MLHTERLLLRPFKLSDANTVQALAGEWDVATMVPTIPHPYPDGAAESWIEYLNQGAHGKEVGFAIVRQSDTLLIGSVTLLVSKQHNKAEIGYWFGRPYWGNGYATEACKRVVDYGFCDMGLNRMYASVMVRNRASCKVLEKIGLKHEGTSPQSLRIRNKYEDISIYGLLKQDYIKTGGCEMNGLDGITAR